MKKQFYILCTIILGVILSYVAHAYIEIFQLNYYFVNGITPVNYPFFGASCFLPYWLQGGLLLLGIVGGYFLGQIWWRIIYVEKRYNCCFSKPHARKCARKR